MPDDQKPLPGNQVDPSETAKAPFYFLGRKLGLYDSIDVLPEAGILVYGFTPDSLCKLPSGDVLLDLGRGLASRDGQSGTPVKIVDAIKDCPEFTQAEWDSNEQRVNDEDGEEDFDLPSDK